MNNFPESSLLMRLLERLNLHSLAWSVRRLHCPVPPSALVLDVGSGGNPYPRANVLLDAFEDTPERFYLPLIKDRPMVLGSVEQMPFRDKAFDYVIASHILEHTPYPEKFINELMRVGKAGYIETPDGFFERINPFRFHRLEVSLNNNSLIIYKKPSWRHDSYIVDSYENQLKCPRFLKFTSKYPKPFYVRYYWINKICYNVVNPTIDSSWPLPNAIYSETTTGLRYSLVGLVRKLYSQSRRNLKINLMTLLACPTCHSNDLEQRNDDITCNGCGVSYPVRGSVPVMFPADLPDSLLNQ